MLELKSARHNCLHNGSCNSQFWDIRVQYGDHFSKSRGKRQRLSRTQNMSPDSPTRKNPLFHGEIFRQRGIPFWHGFIAKFSYAISYNAEVENLQLFLQIVRCSAHAERSANLSGKLGGRSCKAFHSFLANSKFFACNKGCIRSFGFTFASLSVCKASRCYFPARIVDYFATVLRNHFFVDF